MAKGRQRQKSPPADAQVKNLSPRLQEAWRLFEAGDKVMARHEARAVLEGGGASEADVQSANELLERLRMPRIAFILGGLAGVFIVLLILLAVARY